MFQKLGCFFAGLILMVFAAHPALAENLEQDDLAFAFGDTVAAGDLGEMAFLSEREMMETEGEWFGFARYVPVAWRYGVRSWNYVKTFRVKVHYDVKPHRFSDNWGPFRGNRPHYQFTFYRSGVRASHRHLYIPWGARRTWGSHPR